MGGISIHIKMKTWKQNKQIWRGRKRGEGEDERWGGGGLMRRDNRKRREGNKGGEMKIGEGEVEKDKRGRKRGEGRGREEGAIGGF